MDRVICRSLDEHDDIYLNNLKCEEGTFFFGVTVVRCGYGFGVAGLLGLENSFLFGLF